MNRSPLSSVLSLLACVLFISGIVLSASTLLRFPEAERRLTKAIEAAEDLDALAQEFAALDALLVPFNALPGDALADPQALAERAFGAERIEEVRQRADSCGEGYAVNRIEISLKDVPLETVVPFAREAEFLRPPLRLSACTIHASDTRPGVGNVVLGLERIERQE
jgi:hypothetical protein